MNKENVPQDLGALGKLTTEVCYVTDENGKYVTELSNGWQIKSEALDVAWHDIEEKVNAAKRKVENNEASPILFFMELRVMDPAILSAYTGFWKWTIKRHMKPSVFKKLSGDKLKRYAEVFDISVEQLKTMNAHEA
ncbi:hypothetical protein FRZ67_19850 [Panacibacter ginsenosidivorans]|uniref:HTH cro/C1-type domain-containing protein n=1 Tax=Panacibacter ginsenosidivorans TaxID=1813871 RepID=A0A5B8VFV9_9BACT|nr:hypothetical protein [Panacibacter ginsenosidivorans]QEC69446.1 hypothetical protein FRZ67_19850 [Panacibacter ginsenosidivorans]